LEGQSVSHHYRIIEKPANITVALLCMTLAQPLFAKDLDVTKEELVSLHVASIGTKEALDLSNSPVGWVRFHLWALIRD